MLLFYIWYIVVTVCDKVLSQKYISILWNTQYKGIND